MNMKAVLDHASMHDHSDFIRSMDLLLGYINNNKIKYCKLLLTNSLLDHR